jgi:Flp pilus assembly protein TadG
MRLRQNRSADEGQALLEFALVLPILLILIVGIIEFGRAWNMEQIITDAAREGARKAAIADESVTQAQVIQTVKDALTNGRIDPNTATITTNGWDAGTGAPATITVSVPYRFTFFGPLLEWTTSQSNITLKTAFTMRNE